MRVLSSASDAAGRLAGKRPSSPGYDYRRDFSHERGEGEQKEKREAKSREIKMILSSEDILKLLIALVLGGAIGAERELRDKAAGFRTLIFICAGSALYTIFSARLAVGVGNDPTRIAAQIVSGIGFLGAGVILREHGEIRGLTTAATIWLVAALGMGVGGGQYLLSGVATLLVLVVLRFFPAAERLMGDFSQVRTYQVTAPADLEKFASLTDRFHQNHLTIYLAHRNRRDDEMICTWTVAGRRVNHERMIKELFIDKEVKEFDV